MFAQLPEELPHGALLRLLIAIFPANIFMAQHADEWTIAPWLLYLALTPSILT
jgi:uncharacterized membrane protein